MVKWSASILVVIALVVPPDCADALAGYFGRDVTVLPGEADTDTSDEDLRRTPEAELQGP